MLYPTIKDLTKGEYNRYELALATAKCARIITGEYVKQREAAERSLTGNKDTDRPLMSMIDAEYRDEKAVKTAVKRLSNGDYQIVRLTPEEMEEEARREAELANSTEKAEIIPDVLPDDSAESVSDSDEDAVGAAEAGEEIEADDAENDAAEVVSAEDENA